MDGLTIRPVAYADDVFAALIADAMARDGAFMARLRDGWRDGSKRFDRPGETLLGAWHGDRLVAVGGLTLDPYDPAEGLGRVRHFYVIGDARRRGVGAALLAGIVAHAGARFRKLRLRTHNPAAARMYERAGFAPADAPGETHSLLL